MKEETRISSPTGLGIRNDPDGFGWYGAPRGKRKHQGKDYLCAPGQDIYFPLESGKITRIAYPYNDHDYQGVLIEARYISIKMFYFEVWPHLIGKYLKRDEVIGMAQDISKKYGGQMEAHIHLSVVSIDPEFLEA